MRFTLKNAIYAKKIMRQCVCRKTICECLAGVDLYIAVLLRFTLKKISGKGRLVFRDCMTVKLFLNGSEKLVYSSKNFFKIEVLNTNYR